MKTFLSRSLSVISIALLFGACSNQPLENTPVEIVTQAPADAAQTIDLGDGTDADAATLQASAVPCIKYKIKTYKITMSLSNQVNGGSISVVKSPSCKSPIKVTLEGKYTYPNSAFPDYPYLFTAKFDNALASNYGNTYYSYFDLYAGTKVKPGYYEMAFRVKAGNVNKAIVLLKVTLTP